MGPSQTSKERKNPAKTSMAARADRHDLYQRAVQCVEAEIDFVDETYTALRGRQARTLREDFCGTANTSCEWVRRRGSNQAYGVDIDEEVLRWGRLNNVERLTEGADRIELVHGDVLEAVTPPVDVLLAMNFSYWLFKERHSLLGYFRRALDNLDRDGVIFLDAYGGHDSFKVSKDRQKYKNFTYIWDQANYDPITGGVECRIHFKFPDGSRMKDAFRYDWRMWTLPEIRELLGEAGFVRPTVYWEGTDEESGEGNGVFAPADNGEPDPAWVAYLVAEKP